MIWFKDKILPSLITAILLAILGGIWKIYLVVAVVPDKFEDNRVQHERFDELIQQEINHRIEIEKELIKLQTQLEK